MQFSFTAAKCDTIKPFWIELNENLSSPDNDKDNVKIWTWLLILFLRYHGPNIHTERNNNNNNENKIRTNSIGDMLQCSISPNKFYILNKIYKFNSNLKKRLLVLTYY